MARVVDFCPSSDDELPELSTILRKPTDKDTKPIVPVAASPKKDLVPKSASKSVSRKIRRLETNSQVTGNLLFQKCESAETKNASRGGSFLEGSPYKTPMKRRERGAEPPSTIFDNESIFDKTPPQTVRTCRTKRPKNNTIFEDDSEYEPQPRIRFGKLDRGQSRARRLQPKSMIGPNDIPANISKFRPSNNEAVNIMGVSGRSAVDDESSREGEQDGATQVDESSVDRTTGGSSSDGTSYSVFSADGTTQSFGNDTSTSLSSSWEPRPEKQATKDSTQGPVNVLQPRGASSVNRGVPSRAESKAPEVGGVPPYPKLPSGSHHIRGENDKDSGADRLANELSKLHLHFNQDSEDTHVPAKELYSTTPPQTPPKTTKPEGLASPVKQAQIPRTPHRPSVDAFWSQEITDNWNDQHSPRKLVLPPAPTSPSKASPKKDPARKRFDTEKHRIASAFLQELDTKITEGKISDLAESTGGVKLVWSKTLNTTAGRANWRRETIRTKDAGGTEVAVTYKHRASIDLAEKVIDNQDRLLNVLAHEFCHLANFMISGITKNPHGKEFKGWASKCTRTFGDRGVKVTTKHTYEIDFKYVWTCSECTTEYKRHSRSIDPQRHRCGTCKGALQQTRPVPRGGGKPSEYQAFVRDQMKTVKEENPGKPQKEIMKMIAAKWAAKPKAPKGSSEESSQEPSQKSSQVSSQGSLQESSTESPTMQAEVDEQLAADLVNLSLGSST